MGCVSEDDWGDGLGWLLKARCASQSSSLSSSLEAAGIFTPASPLSFAAFLLGRFPGPPAPPAFTMFLWFFFQSEAL